MRTARAGAVLALAQRAEVVGDALRQHRHDAVGEIDRVAALQRLAVERRARPHIMGDVGDGDDDDEAAAVARVGVGLGVDRVVVILASAGSMVTSGISPPVLAAPRVGRLAARRPRVDAPAGRRRECRGRAMAIRLTPAALGIAEPLQRCARAGRGRSGRSRRPRSGPARRLGAVGLPAPATAIPSSACVDAARCTPPPVSWRKMPSWPRALREQLDRRAPDSRSRPASGAGGDARKHAIADAGRPGAARLRAAIRMRGGGPSLLGPVDRLGDKARRRRPGRRSRAPRPAAARPARSRLRFLRRPGRHRSCRATAASERCGRRP